VDIICGSDNVINYNDNDMVSGYHRPHRLHGEMTVAVVVCALYSSMDRLTGSSGRITAGSAEQVFAGLASKAGFPARSLRGIASLKSDATREDDREEEWTMCGIDEIASPFVRISYFLNIYFDVSEINCLNLWLQNVAVNYYCLNYWLQNLAVM